MNCAQRAHMRLFAASFLIAACGATQFRKLIRSTTN